MSLTVDNYEREYIKFINEIYHINVSDIDFNNVCIDTLVDDFNIIQDKLAMYIQDKLELIANVPYGVQHNLCSIHYKITEQLFRTYDGRMLAKKIRESNTLDDFIKICNTKGLDFIKIIFRKSDIKTIN